MLISCSGLLNGYYNVIDLLSFAFGGGTMIFILCIAPILPYGMSYATDTEDKVPPFWVIRAGTAEYAAGKFIVSVVVGYLSVAVSVITFSLAMSAFFPLFSDNSAGDSYTALLKANLPALYILAIANHYGLSAALFAGTSITVSAFIPNKFCVLAAPVVLYFVLMLVTTFMPIHDFLKTDFLIQRIYPDVSPLAAFAYKFIPIAAVLGILLYVTVRKITSRILAS